MHPVVRSIVVEGPPQSAQETFAAMYRRETLRRRAEPLWGQVDVLALPTTGTTYRVQEMLADPVSLNEKLGHYATFVNILDLCGVALPAGARTDRTPFGITLVAPAFADRLACQLGSRYEASARGA